MGALIWLIVAIVLALLELAAGEFTLLMLAGAALITSGVAVADIPLWAEVITFSISALGLLVFVRPALKKRMRRPGQLETSDRRLVGHTAEVLEDVSGDGGQIRLEGHIWSAKALDPTVSFVEGETVTVVSIDGNTAVVWKGP
ncbi:NfeD family protein [Corynebacterium guangdongense]|uniref:Membrane protein implicated in regulation of membrane protease activity n=1 Tax=Corynebacterium guangdongense TaxID=1783348 RepID=A0ABU1ZWQ1_9CORY|nr:NfeD family protein [Corynebacterium guangdongense]MDR7329361.1 membrane protein implicated in regulation of membrane protease activity [Corynebacterium guangdongense]WJZ17926.1 hypothetical protein CGUA_06785 [Corynebacterium guangdongense]